MREVSSLKKSTWDRYAPIYERAMRSDGAAYESMYARISEVVRGKEVLELATGPGLLAKHVAFSTKRMVATDYSEGMIREAKKGEVPDDLTFEVADATDLPYEDASFDVVIIANALHVMPNPERALSEVRRVLRDNGLLIAPNFVSHDGTVVSRIWSWVLKRAGIGFDHQWTPDEYVAFLSDQGWRVVHRQELKARIALLYVECVRIR